MVHPHKRTERIIEDSELPVIQCDYLMLKDTAGTEGLKVFSMHVRIFGYFGSSHFGSSRSFSFEHCFLLHLRKPSYGTSRMERDADPKWLGPSYSRAPSEDRKLAEIETKLCGSEKGPKTSASTSATHAGQVFSDASIPRPEREDHNGQGAFLQVGGSNERDGRTRGGVHSSCPQKSTKSRAGSPRRSTSGGVRGFLDESAVPLGGIGFKESDHHGEHRSVREEVIGIEDQDAGPSSNRSVGGAAIARIGVPIAGPSRVVAGSQCGHPQPESEASLPSRGFRSILRRRIPTMDGGPAQGFANRCGNGTVLRSGEDFSVACASSVGVAAGNPRPSHVTPISSGHFCAVIRHRCGMLGVRVGDASNPGPPSLRRLRRNRSAMCAISSNEEPLIRGTGRNVVARVEGAPDDTQIEGCSETVPESQSALTQNKSHRTSSMRWRKIWTKLRSEFQTLSSIFLAKDRTHRRLTIIGAGNAQAQEVPDVTQWESEAQFSFLFRPEFQSQSEGQSPKVVDMTIGDSDGEQRDQMHRESAGRKVDAINAPHFGGLVALRALMMTSVKSQIQHGKRMFLMQTSTQRVKTDLTMCCQTRKASQKQVRRTLWQRRQKNPKLWRTSPETLWKCVEIDIGKSNMGELSRRRSAAKKGWKLFMVLPRMLLHRPPGGGLIPRSKLVARFEAFSKRS